MLVVVLLKLALYLPTTFRMVIYPPINKTNVNHAISFIKVLYLHPVTCIALPSCFLGAGSPLLCGFCRKVGKYFLFQNYLNLEMKCKVGRSADLWISLNEKWALLDTYRKEWHYTKRKTFSIFKKIFCLFRMAYFAQNVIIASAWPGWRSYIIHTKHIYSWFLRNVWFQFLVWVLTMKH